jgi:hypothetical protein
MEALKTATHTLHKVPTKSVPTTPYELWMGREPSLRYMCVWGCPAEAKVFNTNIGKLDPKTVICHFIGYIENSKGYCFYCPNRHTKFVETTHTVFLEKEMVRGSMVPREIDFEVKWVYVPTSMIQEPIFMPRVVPTPAVEPTVVPEPIASSPVQTMSENQEPVLQDPT